MHGQVKNIFYYILMALTPLRYLVTFMIARTMYTSIDFASYITNGLSYSSLMAELYDVPIPSTLSTLNLLFSAAILIVSVLDIIQVSKQKYPVIGLILFTIFLKPGYFICRAFALKEPKRNAIAYTVFLAALYMGYFSWCLYYAITIAAGSM